MSVFPVIATIISAIFAVMVLRQYMRRRRIYQLVWFVSLVMFTVSAGFETMSEFMGWNVEIYRIYLVLAASQVALMGAGALYLILKKNVFSTKGLLVIDAIVMGIIVFFSWMMTLSHITDYSALLFGAMEYPIAGIGTYAILVVLALLLGRNMTDQQRKMLHGHVFVIFAIILTLWMGAYAAVAEVTVENFVEGIAVAGNAMAQHVRNFSPILTVSGSFLLIGAAFFSFLKTRFTFNLWIALGGLTIALAGSIARTGADFGNVLYIGEVVGIFLLMKGFADSDKVIKEREGGVSEIQIETES
ncbi:MAG: hypothetical protein ACW968_05480 [Candidatus Thorarchaeota archaeon]|jgi:hypothetical protein